MSEAKHTPGEWYNVEESKSESVTISGGRLRLVKADGVIVAFLPQWLDKAEEAQEAKANSNLIAAAPDLLEALVWMVENDDTNEGDTPINRFGGASWNDVNAHWIKGLNKARAAIAKATGGAA